MAFYDKIFPNPKDLLRVDQSTGQLDPNKLAIDIDDKMESFITDVTKFPTLTNRTQSTTIDNKTVSKYQWRVAESLDSEDYIAYEFIKDDVDSAKAALKRALARAKLETYCLPVANSQEMLAFYHYIGNDSITYEGKQIDCYCYRFDYDNLKPIDTYRGWTFPNHKIELGHYNFGTTAKVQHSYDHAELVGFFYPPKRMITDDDGAKLIDLEPEDYEQVIIKTLTCFDLGALPIPTIDPNEAIYYKYSKFLGEWEEIDDFYYYRTYRDKNTGQLITKLVHFKDENFVDWPLPIQENDNEGAVIIYIPIHLMNW